MKNSFSSTVIVSAMAACALWTQGARAQESEPVNQAARAAVQSQAQPEIEHRRSEAQQQAERAIDADAAAAIDETTKALNSIKAGKQADAMAALERAIGKIN